jgi:hypothetical protein
MLRYFKEIQISKFLFLIIQFGIPISIVFSYQCLLSSLRVLIDIFIAIEEEILDEVIYHEYRL